MKLKLIIILLILLFSQQTGEASQYIRDWLILGSFKTVTGEARISHEYLENEIEVNAFGGQQIKDRQWILYHSPTDVINLLDPILKHNLQEQCVAYTQVFVHSPQAQSAQLFLGSDDEIVVWCNSEQIHINSVQKVHKFDQEQVNFTLAKGWNRLLFKIFNGALNWQMSARIETDIQIRIQAENPSDLPENIKPSRRLRIWQIDQHLEPILLENGEARIEFSLLLLNEGTNSLQNVEVELCLNDKSMATLPPISKISGGELYQYQAKLPFEAIDSLLFYQQSPEIRFHHKNWERRELFPLITHYKIVNSIFNHWIIDNWNLRSEGNLYIFEKKLQVPELLNRLELNLQIETEEGSWTCLVNERRQATDFINYSGNIVIRRQGNNNRNFNLKLIHQPAPNHAGTVDHRLFSAKIRPYFSGIETYLQDHIFAKEIFNTSSMISPTNEAKIYQLLTANNQRELSKLLKELDQAAIEVQTKADSLAIVMVGHSSTDLTRFGKFPQATRATLIELNSVIQNLKDKSDFTFCHGQAFFYQWIEQNEPDLFKQIKKYVKNGQWEIIGGTWMEPDLILSNGESQIRQYLYGKHYFKQKFDVDVTTGWLATSCGQSTMFPQILKKCGLTTFTLLNSNETTAFSYWKSPDGSQIFRDDVPEKYNFSRVNSNIWQGIIDKANRSDISNGQYLAGLRFFEVQAEGKLALKQNIETIQQLDKLKVYPKVDMGRMDDYYTTLISQKTDSTYQGAPIPVKNNQFTIGNPGCLTSHAKIKWNNRRNESLISIAETFACLGTYYKYVYPEDLMKNNWQGLLATQHPKILSGLASTELNKTVEQRYEFMLEGLNQILNPALKSLVASVNTQFSDSDAQPFLVFNSLNWSRSTPVEIVKNLNIGMKEFKLYDTDGQPVPLQVIEKGNTVRFIFLAKNIPEMGYRTYWLEQTPNSSPPQKISYQLKLENDFLRVKVNQKTGTIDEFYDKKLAQIILTKNAGEFQIQADISNILPICNLGLKGPITHLNQPTSVEVVENGAVRKVIRVEYHYKRSIFVQKYVLYHELPQLFVQVTANWLEHDEMVKIAFPVEMTSPITTYNIPFGTAVDHGNGQELATQKWCDVSDKNFGLTLLNDCKYGFDVNGSTLRISALRSPSEPDSTIDLGYHSFSYALYSHSGNWKAANSMQQGYNFNVPLVYILTDMHKGKLPPSSSFLVIEPDNVIVSALKKAENNDDTILRLYETSGKATTISLKFPKSVYTIYETDILENPQEKLTKMGYFIEIAIAPYEIKTLRIAFLKKKTL